MAEENRRLNLKLNELAEGHWNFKKTMEMLKDHIKELETTVKLITKNFNSKDHIRHTSIPLTQKYALFYLDSDPERN